MLFEKLKEPFVEVQSDAQKVMQSSLNYYKLLMLKIATVSVSQLVTILIIGVITFFMTLFFAIAGAFALGDYLDNNALGFLIVGAVFFVVMLIILIFRKRMIETPILSSFSKKYFKE